MNLIHLLRLVSPLIVRLWFKKTDTISRLDDIRIFVLDMKLFKHGNRQIHRVGSTIICIKLLVLCKVQGKQTIYRLIHHLIYRLIYHFICC